MGKVFGAISWELARVLLDKGRICKATPGDMKKAYSKAERFETQAERLLEKLKSEKLKDPNSIDLALRLSRFAPPAREAQWHANDANIEQGGNGSPTAALGEASGKRKSNMARAKSTRF